MKIGYLFPEELPLKAARGIQATHTVYALAEGEEVYFFPARFAPETPRLYDLPPSCPQIKAFSRKIGPIISLWFYLIGILPYLRRLEVLFTRHLKCALLLLKIQGLHRLPVYYEAHELFFEKTPSLREKEKQVFQGVRGVICVSEGLRKAIQENFSREGTVVPNGTRLLSVDLKTKFSSLSPEIFYVGSFRYSWKGTETLLKALDYLPSRAKLVVLGETNLKHPKVKALGFKWPFEVKRLLSRARFAVLPNSSQSRQSKYYTCPLKLLDYMASGCAIIASDLPSVREIVSPKEAFFVPPDDPYALSEGIKHLLKDPRLSFSLASSAYQKARDYTWKKRAQRIISLLKGDWS